MIEPWSTICYLPWFRLLQVGNGSLQQRTGPFSRQSSKIGRRHHGGYDRACASCEVAPHRSWYHCALVPPVQLVRPPFLLLCCFWFSALLPPLLSILCWSRMFANKGLFDDDGEVDVDSRSHAAQQNARPMASRTGQSQTGSRAAHASLEHGRIAWSKGSHMWHARCHLLGFCTKTSVHAAYTFRIERSPDELGAPVVTTGWGQQQQQQRQCRCQRRGGRRCRHTRFPHARDAQSEDGRDAARTPGQAEAEGNGGTDSVESKHRPNQKSSGEPCGGVSCVAKRSGR
jgi:hypothetical protein